MITNFEQKEHINKQIVRLENALADIKEKTLPKNPKLFEVMSKSYIDKIKELRKEVDLYIGIQDDKMDADFIVRLLGPEIGYGKAPISVVSNVLDELRKGFQNVFAHLLGYKNIKKVPNNILNACDMKLTRVFEGSLQVALQRPEEQLNLLGKSEFDKTAEYFFSVASWATEKGALENIINEIPDDDLRDVVFKSVLRVIPNNPRKVNRIHLYGPIIKKEILLTKQSRDFIINSIAKKDEEDIIYAYKGRIREVDLDKGSFKLREIENNSDLHEIIGHIKESLLEDLKGALDDIVEIRGVLKQETKSTKTLDVRYIENSNR
jgi:hypothetical protein